jgi:hypothetical protein
MGCGSGCLLSPGSGGPEGDARPVPGPPPIARSAPGPPPRRSGPSPPAGHPRTPAAREKRRAPVPAGRAAGKGWAPRPLAFPWGGQVDESVVFRAGGGETGRGQGIRGRRPAGASQRGWTVGSKTGSEVSSGEREIADGLEEPAGVSMTKDGLEAELRYRPHPASAGGPGSSPSGHRPDGHGAAGARSVCGMGGG